MPKQELPNDEEFAKFARKMSGRQFVRQAASELSSDIRRLGLVAPSPRTGRETGFFFHANGHTAVVWTTFDETIAEARESDQGWVLIKEGDKARYFSHPFNRTKNFLDNLFKAACIAQQRVLTHPLCPDTACLARMRIVHGPGLKSCYYVCRRFSRHANRKQTQLDWDQGLSLGARREVEKIRKKRRQYAEMLKKIGKKPGAALRKRIGWKVIRPQNEM